MHFTNFLAAAAAVSFATVSADDQRSAVTENAKCNKKEAHASIVNRCDYDVHIWSVYKGTGCPGNGMVTLKKGETYSENYLDKTGDPTGVSIKISKTEQCKGNDIVQLEYFLETRADKVGFQFNYLDVSYVDCESGDCPTKKEGYYLQAGSQTGASIASAGNTWCPILACNDPISCAKMSYILPDDVQTKTCGLDQNMTFYMCGGNAPSDDSYSAPASSAAPASSKQVEYSTAAKPTTTLNKVVSSSAAAYKVNAAAVTNAPEVKEKTPKIKTEVVYVTKYDYVNAKRHGHARRHQAHKA